MNTRVPEDVELFLEKMFVVTRDDDVIASGFPDVIVEHVVSAMHAKRTIKSFTTFVLIHAMIQCYGCRCTYKNLIR